jgi:glycosyltransferase involved in cell wall biosynthesis
MSGFGQLILLRNLEITDSLDPEAMAFAIESICNLPNADWQAMSEAAYAKVVIYSWEDATERFETALKVAINKSKQHGGEVKVPIEQK